MPFNQYHYNIKIGRLSMAQNQHFNPAAYYNIFKVSLTREQQTVLTDFLPTNYSFQPFKCTRSLDEESLRSQPLKVKKKKNRQQKDPDYSASYVCVPKQVPPPPSIKIQSSQTIPGGQPFIQCYNILRRLKKSHYSWPFRNPVDPKALGIPEYSNIVLEPMDLRTIEDNIRKQAYKHPAQFHRDIYKILMNSYKFNQKKTQVFAITAEFQEEYLKVLKEAKEGKLIPPQKKIKIEGGLQDDTPVMIRQKSSFEQKPKQIIKKEKQDENKDKLKEKLKDKMIPQIGVKEEAKQMEKYESIDKFEKLKQKQKTKQIKMAKQQKIKKKQWAQNYKMKQKQRQHEKQKEKQKRQVFEEEKQKQDTMKFDIFEASQEKNTYKLEKDQFSLSNDPIKKSRIKLGESKKQKKFKDKTQNLQTMKQIKELKQVTQFQNEKGIMVNTIQKKLTDLLKKFSEYQLPRPKQKIPAIRNTELQHPNFNNFSNITTSEKKRLVEKIYQLSSSELEYIIQICYRKRDKKRDQEGVYQFDLEKMDAKTLKELSNFVAMRTKHLKKTPRGRNESSRVASSQMQPAQQHYLQVNFQFQAEEEDEYHPDEGHLDSQQDKMHQQIEEQLILQHPGDDIHSHMLQPNFQFPSGELMEIDDDGRSDSYQPDDENYHF